MSATLSAHDTLVHAHETLVLAHDTLVHAHDTLVHAHDTLVHAHDPSANSMARQVISCQQHHCHAVYQAVLGSSV